MKSVTENPLHCGCESQELWEWLRDHQKLVGIDHRNGNNQLGSIPSMDSSPGSLRCDQPPELRGLVFLDLDPRAFCSSPLVIKLAIQDIQPFSVLVSWQSRNHSGLHGYQVAYHTIGNVNEVFKVSDNSLTLFVPSFTQEQSRINFLWIPYQSLN